ncbi:MAG: 16S rRNA (guanine(527)-N(7))-methyltransferase RsmG [Defluviitaleaceae bacterium]|nr:16S rRNA (guanine(527)-N(7))-methyltransferase RsmG [Defluviitaleaceae bacterium]MCL2204321.1 16S rRNA (guanine(527)-N(7))-methyltransferase RsmG [Defluviitaleaceae bacterium]
MAPTGFALTHAQLSRLDAYKKLVLTANEKMNLTAITSDADFALKHFKDSLSLLPILPPENQPFSLLDIGTGAGFPGVPLKIARPNIRLTLLDSLRKRVFFLRDALDALGIEAQCIHGRAEDMPRLYPGTTYDICTARAVAPLKKLCAYALPLVRPGGYFLAMKGPDITQEAKEAAPVLAKLGAEIKNTIPVELAPGMVHTVVCIAK